LDKEASQDKISHSMDKASQGKVFQDKEVSTMG